MPPKAPGALGSLLDDDATRGFFLFMLSEVCPPTTRKFDTTPTLELWANTVRSFVSFRATSNSKEYPSSNHATKVTVGPGHVPEKIFQDCQGRRSVLGSPLHDDLYLTKPSVA